MTRSLPTGNSPKRDGCRLAATRGFTLLELLVVVFIVGIIAAMFTLSVGVVGGTDRELRREAQRLETLVGLALEDANFQSRELGLRFYPGKYEFSVLDRQVAADPTDDRWVPIRDDVFAPRELPDAFAFELEIEGRAANLERSARDVEKRYEPQIFIFSSGDISDAFTVYLRSREEDMQYVLEFDIDGTSELTSDNE